MSVSLSAYPSDLPRLYLPSCLEMGENIVLEDGQAHYLRNVLRRSEGDFVRVFNAQNGEWMGKISFPTKKTVALQILESLRSPLDPDRLPRRHLVFSPIKKDRQDWLIEKAVELGVTDLHPVLMNRSVVRDIRADRVQAQIIEACEQCERLDLATLHPLQNLKQFVQQFSDGAKIYAALERQDAVFLGDVLKDGVNQNIFFLIGPEGGFDQDELIFLTNSKGVCPVSLGPRILRAETAAIFGLSLFLFPAS